MELEVAPLVGAWIEIQMSVRYEKESQVAPLVGAWIEIRFLLHRILSGRVAPLVGAWIEISCWLCASYGLWSLPLWERGLK